MHTEVQTGWRVLASGLLLALAVALWEVFYRVLHEESHGILTSVPFSLALVAVAPLLLLPRLRSAGGESRSIRSKVGAMTLGALTASVACGLVWARVAVPHAVLVCCAITCFVGFASTLGVVADLWSASVRREVSR
jgi:hypothetical protein